MRDNCGILKKHIALEIKKLDWVPTFLTYYLCDTGQAIQIHLICEMNKEELSTSFAVYMNIKWNS